MFKLIMPRRIFLPNGFTIIELALVMGVLFTLLTIVIIVIDPAKQIGRANNTQRLSDASVILNAVGAYASDNKGMLPGGITTSVATISASGADICSTLVPKYLPSLPVDPSFNLSDITTCTNYNSGYTIVKDSNSRVTVAAPLQQYGEVISITR